MDSSGDREDPTRVERMVDRYWFLVQRRRGSAPQAGTVVLRDGESIVVSVEAHAIGWPDGTLLFRLRSEQTPCVGCVDRALAFALSHTGRPLTPADVREMLRFAVTRCAALGEDPAHPPASAPRPGDADSIRAAEVAVTAVVQADWRRAAEMWLVL
jgi:hypothetical protein